MEVNHIFIISPPFYSHFNPLLAVGKSLKEKGKKVSIGCSKDFQETIENAGLDFYPLTISKNKNIKKAETTNQPDSEKERLDEFFAATYHGPIETLITQSRHRQKDMLHEPEALIKKIAQIDESLTVDLYIVDILSYGVTLSLHALNLAYVTFCPPHPNTIPLATDYYGVPRHWPTAFDVNRPKLDELITVSKKTQAHFTDTFNQLIKIYGQESQTVENAFSVVSPLAVLYNYFEFQSIESINTPAQNIFMGHAFEEEELSNQWQKRIKNFEQRILVTLGTFLSNRADVLEKIIKSAKIYNPQALIIVSAGSQLERLKQYRSPSVIIEEFIPQKGLLPHMNRVIFHGGCNTFTEAIYYDKPMVILPFSSDQFNIAYDAEKEELAEILDPNNFREKDLVQALTRLDGTINPNLRYWSKVSQNRGPDYAVEKLLEGLEHRD